MERIVAIEFLAKSLEGWQSCVNAKPVDRFKSSSCLSCRDEVADSLSSSRARISHFCRPHTGCQALQETAGAFGKWTV
ncbi:hypothetical protein KM043_013298 [Ampulex compressa]|nr:hypothetical protein KM043_013298 [Ampulex compressa]